MHSVKCFFCQKPGLTGEVIYLIFSVCAMPFIQNNHSHILTAIMLPHMLSLYLPTSQYDSKLKNYLLVFITINTVKGVSNYKNKP